MNPQSKSNATKTNCDVRVACSELELVTADDDVQRGQLGLVVPGLAVAWQPEWLRA